MKAHALDRQVKCGMIDKNHPILSVVGQCCFVSISRLSFYHELTGGTALSHDLMVVIDKQSHEIPLFRVQRKRSAGAGSGSIDPGIGSKIGGTQSSGAFFYEDR